jgi:hypothetical protein
VWGNELQTGLTHNADISLLDWSHSFFYDPEFTGILTDDYTAWLFSSHQHKTFAVFFN